MVLRREQQRELHDALLSAFPSYSTLVRMVRYSLDENLEMIASGGSLQDVVFQLIVWAESRGQLDELLAGALRENPRNPSLLRLCEKVSVSGQPVPGTGTEDPPSSLGPQPSHSLGTPRALLDALNALLPAQFEEILFLLSVPRALLPSSVTAQAERSIDLLRYLESTGRLGELRELLVRATRRA